MSTADLELQALAAIRAFMRQPGGPDLLSMCRFLEWIADEIDESVACWSNDWQADTARMVRSCVIDLELDLERSEESALDCQFGGPRAGVGSLFIRGDV